MTLTYTTTTYGQAAFKAVRDAVHNAKGDDPLTPVTLLVPTEHVGVTTRRFLAQGLAPGRPAVAGLTVLTVRRLAEVLAGPGLAAQDRRPLTDPVLAAAIRRVLGEDAGLFEQVREHTGTVRAIAQAHRELRDVARGQKEALRGHSALVDDVLRVHDAITESTHSRWFDGVDLTSAAIAHLQVDPAAATPLGLVVGVLLQDLDVHERDLLTALADVTDVHLVVGLTGDPRADAGPLAAATLGSQPEQGAPVGHRVLHATDPDDEVRCVVREVVTALRAGTPGHRVAVLYGSADPYARLLHEHLAAADVTVHGRGVRPTAERLLGRAVLRLLTLPDHDYRRDEVLALVADAPVQWQGRRAPSTPWERASRAAGVVGGDDWERLAAAAATLRERAQNERERPEEQCRAWVVNRNEREAEDAESLLAFVASLLARLDALDQATCWADASDVLRDLWCEVLGGDDVGRYPVDERRAADRVAAVLDGLASLDAVDATGAPGLAAVREVVELELADDLDRVGSMGVGVHVGPVSDAVGLDVDLVVLVGMAEGLLPGRHRDDPLLPDELRQRTGGALPTLRDRLDRQHRHVLAALAGGQRRLLTFPRGDLRRGGERVPSRWLLPTLRALTGVDSLQASTWQEPCAGVHDVVEIPSHAAHLEAAALQATAQEWRQRAVLARTFTENDDRRLAASLTLRRGRRSSSFTRFDGNLVGTPGLPDPRQNGPLSPTALEAWTACPHHYLMSYILRVAPVEEPEALVRIDHRDRGNLVHRVLERFVEENLGRSPDAAWTDDDGKRLDEIADEEFADAEARGITGFRRLWEQDREALRADLRAWLAADSTRRSTRRATPVATELPFGAQGHSPAVLDLGDGTSLLLKGKADRVDRCEDGSLLVVDYKSGRRRYWPVLTSADPTLRGVKLQLPVYALAARQHLDAGTAPVRAEYWFVNRASDFGDIGLDVDDRVLDETREVLRAIAGGISAGVFVARPRNEGNTWGCETCEAYGAGDAAVKQAWETKLDDPSLAAYLRLITPDSEEASR